MAESITGSKFLSIMLLVHQKPAVLDIEHDKMARYKKIVLVKNCSTIHTILSMHVFLDIPEMWEVCDCGLAWWV
jgi:hypothetical protein